MEMKRFIFVCFLTIYSWSVSGQIEGKVIDEDGISLPSASILLLPDSLGLMSNADGTFAFSGIQDGQYQLKVNYLGYQERAILVQVKQAKSEPVIIRLEATAEILESVVVTDEHAKQEETLSSIHFSEELLARNLQGTFAKSIENLPGIAAINVGVGIAKPVIRGLSFNRIIVNHQGIKQESQQWGADHGLELDQYDIERVEIIKGPASLQYGSDGLGGVINIKPGRLIPKNTFRGSILGVHKTNNDHWAGSANLAINYDNFFVTARYSRQDFGDYQVPADQFIYNSFVLPILNNQLKNTAGNEESFSISTGLSRSWGVSRITFSKYALEAGLFSGAVGIPRSYALDDDGNSRDIDIPKQEVEHYKLSFNQTLLLGENHININLGYQKNFRQEFSFPEFHSIPSSQIDPDNTLALQFNLETVSGNIHYEIQADRFFKTILGANAQWQSNDRAGFEFLLPDFRTFRGGAFVLVEKNIRSNWLINGGLRFDYAINETEFFRQLVWDSNENITDSLLAPITNDEFFNWSASFGSNWTLIDEQWYLKVNLGKSFRVPYPAETVSNGIHHGTFRHEMGTPDLQSEHGYQLDISTDFEKGKFYTSFSTYFNFFDNYIYLGPTFPARFSPLPEAGQIFQYQQNDAIYTGFEWEWNYQALSFLSIEQAVDFIQSYNIETSLALPFTPPPSIRTALNLSKQGNNWMEEAFFSLSHLYRMAAEGQLRIDRSEDPTPAYQLWELGAGLKLKWFHFNVQIQNLFNISYLNHLSRYRIINVPEQGRNIVLSLKVPFEGKLKK